MRYWLDQIRDVLVKRETPTQMTSLATYVQAAVRELQKFERQQVRPAASTEDAQLAIAGGIELVSRV
ncbi:hypothetical protein [Streptomyces sp.]|uniref:hypothetical protein n=1 Tax=Streptomyces sp. TaxID=1931 RepID=UPI002D789001|nr:hypothetical protein [Streptomyces sp.]HET6356500.1 hypothetical protein [Streptomyces sp.]